MNTTIRINRKITLAIVFILLLIGIGVAIYLLSQQQEIRQRAAGPGPDLVVTTFQLTDAAGNVKTRFYVNEDIYVKIKIKNIGDAVGTSTTGRTISQVYSNKFDPVADNLASDIDVSLNNGQFSAGSERLYESRIGGTSQNVFVSDPFDEGSTRKYSWRRGEAPRRTARIHVNFNRDVAESDYTNNQASLDYEVVAFTSTDETGTTSSTKPSDFDNAPCIERNSLFVTGFSGCVQQITNSINKVQGRVTNNTSQAQLVALASYKAYYPYQAPGCTQAECPDQYIFTWTQTFYNAKTYNLDPGETIYLSTSVPACAWQADIFINGIPKSFHPNINTYGSGIGYVDGWYHFYPNYDQNNTTYCVPVIPSPTPTVPPSITPSTNPSATPSPTVPPSITPSTCPTPAKVTNIRIICPNCTQ